MKYSLNQIKRYVPGLSTIDTKVLIDRVWESIAEIEHVDYLAEKYANIIVGKILTVENHPKSDHLKITTVDIGTSEPVIVVSGAPNITVGDFVPYLGVGAVVPSTRKAVDGPLVISVRSMVGVDSVGMLASARELDLGDNHDGIMILRPEELRKDIVPGENFASAVELDDVIIEIENKTLTHRGDCFSAAGLAREIAALFNLEYVLPEWQIPGFSAVTPFMDTFDKELPCTISTTITANEAVERYSAIVLDGIQVRPSQLWLQLFLLKHGVNPVNNVVDIANYVMLDYGQPMHAFDASTVSHRKKNEKIDYGIVVRYAKNGEKLMTLDGKEKVLNESIAVISDTKNALAVAGIIGGKESGINENSTRIILESAVFDKYAIRNASMTLGTVTDGSVIYSRKQDTEKTVRGLLRAVHLLGEVAGAMIVSQISDTYITKPQEKVIVLSHDKIEQILGVGISVQTVSDILSGLGMVITKKNNLYSVTIPSWRPDITIDEDLYEEIARMFGYHKIHAELPKRGLFAVKLNDYEQYKQQTLKVLTGYGFMQSMNFTFVSKALYEQCILSVTDAHVITNAISPDVQYIRKYVLPGLLSQLAKNQYVVDHMGLFEIGKVMRKSLTYTSMSTVPATMPALRFGVDELGLPIEDEHLAFGIIDDATQPAFFTLKAYVLEYLVSMNIENVIFVHPSEVTKKEKTRVPLWADELQQSLRSGRTAYVFLQNGKERIFVGIIGEPNTLVARSFGYTKGVAVAELSLSVITNNASLEPTYREPSKFPVVTEDYSIEVPIETAYERVIQVLTDAVSTFDQVQTTFKPVDIYQKQPKTKQVTVRTVFAPVAATLTDEEVNTYRKAIAHVVKENLEGKIL